MTPDNLPRTTKETVILPTGESVLVVILNSLYREQADTETRRFAVRACLRFRKGGADYKPMQAEIRSKGEDEQAAYLAQKAAQSIFEQSASLYPSEPEPEQGEETPEAYALAFEKWQKAEQSTRKKRAAWEETEWQREVERCKALPAKDRLAECENLYFALEFATAYGSRMQWETLYRACRHTDAPAQRYFDSPEELEGAEDAVQTLLWDAYQRLEVSAAAVPTSPQNSPE